MNTIYKALGKGFQVNRLVKFTIRFGSKKNTKPSAGSDVEVDKTKKSIKGATASNSDNETKTQSIQQQTATIHHAEAKKAEEIKVPETPVKQAPIQKQAKEETVDQSKPDAPVENVRIIKTVSTHKPPISEETVGGRYAQTLFITASKKEDLYNVFNDMTYLNSIYEKSEAFRTFADNAGLNSNQINTFVSEMAKCGEFSNSTLAFLDLLGKNKRFMYVNEIAKKYIRSYNLLSREEKIKIISASELNDSQKKLVKEAILANPENSGKSFVIEYEINPAILGGLQMYCENRFMDLSLSSRVDKLKEEVNKFL